MRHSTAAVGLGGGGVMLHRMFLRDRRRFTTDTNLQKCSEMKRNSEHSRLYEN